MKCPVCKTEIEATTKECPICRFTKLHVEFVSTDDAVSWVERVVIPYRMEWEKNRNNVADLFESMKARQFSRIMKVSALQDLPFEFEIDEKGAVITRYTGSDEDIQIPSYYNNVPVYKINDGVFRNCLELKHIELPVHLHIIGKSAFAGSSLVGIQFNEELIEIGDNAFMDTDLGEVIIPDSVKYIGESAFRFSKFPEFDFFDNKPMQKQCTTDIKLGRNVEFIGKYAFSQTATTELIFPDKLQIIPESVCFLCADLTTVVVLGAKSIGIAAFSGCRQLSGVMLPECLERIEESAFSGCSNLRKIILPENVEYIASNSVFFEKFNYTLKEVIYEIAFLCDNTCIVDVIKNDYIMKKYNQLERFDTSKVVFYCNPGSSAQKYARESGIRCRPLIDFADC